MIQRKQTIFMILSIASMLFFMSVPYVDRVMKGSTTHELLYVKDDSILSIFSVATIVLVAVAIFMYKTLRRQYMLTMIALVLNLIVVAMLTFDIFTSAEYADVFKVQIGGFLPSISLLLLLLASRGIIKDYNTLRSADRLR